jgi:hypothetical protein
MFKDFEFKPHVQEIYFHDESMPDFLKTTSIEEEKGSMRK